MCFFMLTLVVYMLLACALGGKPRESNSQTYQPAVAGQHVAIIGAGVAGASAAFHLLAMSRPASNISVTVFETSEQAGGRVATNPIPQSHQMSAFEAGASHISTDDECLSKAARAVWPHTESYQPIYKTSYLRRAGVWDGHNFTTERTMTKEPESWWDLVSLDWLLGPWYLRTDTMHVYRGTRAICNMDHPYWWDTLRLSLKYGPSPWRFYRLIGATNKLWDRVGNSDYFTNIASELHNVGLDTRLFDTSATDYLTQLGISLRFQTERVQPCVRSRAFQNLDGVSAFVAIMSCRESRETSMWRGNARLIKGMIEMSKSELRLENPVVEISQGQNHRYTLSFSHNGEIEHRDFDTVILAHPLRDRNSPRILVPLKSSPRQFPRTFLGLHNTSVHITHFVTSSYLAPVYLSLPSTVGLPERILTTASDSNDPSLLAVELSSNYFSLEQRRAMAENREPQYEECATDDGGVENLYRVVSRHRIGDEELARMMGRSWTAGQQYSELGLSWVHRKEWPLAVTHFEKGRPLPGTWRLQTTYSISD